MRGAHDEVEHCAACLRAAVPRCALDGSDDLAAEIRATERRIELSR